MSRNAGRIGNPKRVFLNWLHSVWQSGSFLSIFLSPSSSFKLSQISTFGSGCGNLQSLFSVYEHMLFMHLSIVHSLPSLQSMSRAHKFLQSELFPQTFPFLPTHPFFFFSFFFFFIFYCCCDVAVQSFLEGNGF